MKRFLLRFMGFLLPSLLGAGSARGDPSGPLAPRQPHFPARAKRMILLYMTGGVSHIDTFDPKPALRRDHGKEIEADHPEIEDWIRTDAPHRHSHPGTAIHSADRLGTVFVG